MRWQRWMRTMAKSDERRQIERLTRELKKLEREVQGFRIYHVKLC